MHSNELKTLLPCVKLLRVLEQKINATIIFAKLSKLCQI